jgi:hypothetical protein
MIGRILATFGWVAWQIGRPFRATPLRRLRGGPVILVALLLLVGAAVPIVAPLLDPQPEDVTAQQIFDHATVHPDGWIRLRGQVVPLRMSPTGERGSFGLLVDADNRLRAVVVEGAQPLDAAVITELTGTLTPAAVAVTDELPISATTAGTPPRVVPDQAVSLDPVPKPVRVIPWWLAVAPVLLALVTLVGLRAGYPIFRPTTEIDVLVSPLGLGERVPTAYAGRIGPSERPLTDPGGALLLVRRGPKGSLLTAQPLPDDGGVAPAPVTIGGSWTSGRVGAVHTVTETVPALEVRSELVNATFLFARNTERDRVAALVAVER